MVNRWPLLGGAAGALVLAPILLIALIVGLTPPPATAAGTGSLRAGVVPAAWHQAVQTAGRRCPALTPALLAAQLQQESGWNPAAVSPVGAQGLAQFMPGTWSTHGIDASGDGIADPFDPLDAIASAAVFDCALAADLAGVPGDPTDNMLAGYNAGPGAVVLYGGIPPYAETRGYIRSIRAAMATFAGPITAGGGARSAVVSAALSMIGVPYSWGGGGRGADGPSAGTSGVVGFDCSGLTSWAFQAGAGVTIGGTAAVQQAEAAPVPADRAQPGDLVFYGQPAGHVGIYLGGGQMVDAPRSGAFVRIEPLWPNATFGRL